MVEVDIAAVRLARVEAVEKAAPWKTKVSQLMKLFKEDAELNAIKQPVLRRFYEDQNEMISFMEERYIMDQEGRTVGHSLETSIHLDTLSQHRMVSLKARVDALSPLVCRGSVQETVKQDEEASTASTQLAINLSFALNVALVVLKMIALVISGTHLSITFKSRALGIAVGWVKLRVDFDKAPWMQARWRCWPR